MARPADDLRGAVPRARHQHPVRSAVGPGPGGGREDPLALYWAQDRRVPSRPALLEAADYVMGVPAKAQRLELLARPGGGFVAEGGGLFKKAAPLDISAVVNACHGGPGEDGTLQAAFDLAGLRYTGPSAAGAALGMDKLAFAGAMQVAGIPTLPRRAFGAGFPDPDFPGPYIVKPRFGGSSIGIEITDDLASARALVRTSPHFRDGAVVEPYLPDALDLNVSVRAYPSCNCRRSRSRCGKTGPGGSTATPTSTWAAARGCRCTPRAAGRAGARWLDRVLDLARLVAGVALVRGVPRIDFLWRGDEVWVNEINTIPGSMAFYFWAAEGVTQAALLGAMIAEATTGPARRFVTDGADGTALRSAGSIAGKLA